MEFGISTRCFGSTPVTESLLEITRKAGLPRIELYANGRTFDFRNKSWMRGIASWFHENKETSASLHLPFEDWNDDRPAPLSVLAIEAFARQRALDEIKRCLELTERLAIDYAVLHLGTPGQPFHPTAFDFAFHAVAVIQNFSGVRVLIETLDNDIATARRIPEFINLTQLAQVGVCYDTGHGEWDNWPAPPDAMHLNDNDGADDAHLWPFEGKRSWPILAADISRSTFDGPLIFEIGSDFGVGKAQDCRNRFKDLVDEARYSIEEFSLKYKLPSPKQEDDQ